MLDKLVKLDIYKQRSFKSVDNQSYCNFKLQNILFAQDRKSPLLTLIRCQNKQLQHLN